MVGLLESHPVGLDPSIIQRLDSISELSGYLSVSFWLFAQLPQVIKNHKDKSVDGFSLGFLLCWFAGDFLNLISCLMNNAMMFQILLSGYYCLIDIILAFQYYYYKRMYHNPNSKWYHRPKKHIHSPRTSLRDNLANYGSIDAEIGQPQARPPTGSRVKGIFKNQQSFGMTRLISTAIVGSLPKVNGIPIQVITYEKKENNSFIYRLLYLILHLDYNMGKVLAWLCTLLYLTSRFPQLWTNDTLKTTKGVSLKLITFALFGNLFYSMSLLLSENSLRGGEESKEFWKAELSYFLGAIGTVLFDFIAILQWIHYDSHSNRTNHIQSVRLKAYTPKSLKSQTIPKSVPLIHSRTSSMRDGTKIDPIEMAASVKSTLSPQNVRKLNEFTPLSPMDLLLDGHISRSYVSSTDTKTIPQKKRPDSIKSVHRHNEDLLMTFEE